MNQNDWGDVIADEAKKWAGAWFREGVSAQCMMWVREVLARVGHPYANRATTQPVDKMNPGIGYANSLAGRDMGQMIVEKSELETGDILFWNDTYNDPRNPWPKNTITHVGIYIGNGEIVHRPTRSRPVERMPFQDYTSGVWRCALRVAQERNVKTELQRPPAPMDVSIIFQEFANSNGYKLKFFGDVQAKTLYQVYKSPDGVSKLVPE